MSAEELEEKKIDPRDDWRLEKLEIEFKQSYRSSEPSKYEGRIRFQNGDYESFSFKLRDDMVEPYIDLISGDIVRGATNLGQRLLKSLQMNDRIKRLEDRLENQSTH